MADDRRRRREEDVTAGAAEKAPRTTAERDVASAQFEKAIPPESQMKLRPRPGGKKATRGHRTQKERELSLTLRMCGVRNKRTGKPCRNPLRVGAVVCFRHGGNNAGSLRREQERASSMMARAKARRLLSKIADDPENVSDPLAALENIAGQMLTLMEMCRAEIDRVDELRRESDQGLEQIRGEVTIYLQTAQRAESILERIIRLDLDERRLRLQAAQAAFVFDCWERALDSRSAKLTDSQRQALWKALQKEIAPGLPRPTRPDAIVDAKVVAELLELETGE
jgi:hypothetical protein